MHRSGCRAISSHILGVAHWPRLEAEGKITRVFRSLFSCRVLLTEIDWDRKHIKSYAFRHSLNRRGGRLEILSFLLSTTTTSTASQVSIVKSFSLSLVDNPFVLSDTSNWNRPLILNIIFSPILPFPSSSARTLQRNLGFPLSFNISQLDDISFI